MHPRFGAAPELMALANSLAHRAYFQARRIRQPNVFKTKTVKQAPILKNSSLQHMLAVTSWR